MPRRSSDFAQPVLDLLAKRVGMRCSNPNCRQPTSGPHSDPKKAVNVGVGGHITAASKGGPRYDDTLTDEERKSPDNGIWLCQKCGKLVDSDDPRYTVDVLNDWKRLSEEAARLDIERGPQASAATEDRTRVRFFRQVFDRPAFQDPFAVEGSVEDLDQALADTITALNTGAIRDRNGVVLVQGEGKSFIEHNDWRHAFDAIVALLRSLRERLQIGLRMNDLQLGPSRGGRQFYAFHDRELAEWVDSTRGQILELVNKVCLVARVPPLHVPSAFGRRF